jgi:hypothetical protein
VGRGKIRVISGTVHYGPFQQEQHVDEEWVIIMDVTKNCVKKIIGAMSFFWSRNGCNGGLAGFQSF